MEACKIGEAGFALLCNLAGGPTFSCFALTHEDFVSPLVPTDTTNIAA